MSRSITDVALECRAHGVTEVTLDNDGNVIALKLGPEPTPPEPKQETQAPAPERSVNRQLAYAASGRPVPRATG